MERSRDEKRDRPSHAARRPELLAPEGQETPRDWRPGAREARLSRYCLLWLLAAPFVGLVLAETVFGPGPAGRWELWKAALLGDGADDPLRRWRVLRSPIRPEGLPGRDSVPDPEAGLGLAAAISAALREETSSHRAALHLFQAAPLPLAVMVGHLWNRMPMTHLYEDLGPGAGYTSSFTI